MAKTARGEEVIESAMQKIANAVTVEQLRQAQAVVLPLPFAPIITLQAAVFKLIWVRLRRCEICRRSIIRVTAAYITPTI